MLLNDIFVAGLDRKKFDDSASVVNSTIAIISEDKNLLSLLDILNSHTDYLYAHSLAVSTYSVIIAQKMGIEAASILFKISLGGLFHDIGKKEIDKAILDKPRNQMTPEELLILESHSFRGKEILMSIPSVPSDVALIVLHHHENVFGQGPLKLKGLAIHPMAKIVSVANKFSGLVIKHPQRELLNPSQALERIISYHLSELDPLCLLALLKVFNHPIPLELRHIKIIN